MDSERITHAEEENTGMSHEIANDRATMNNSDNAALKTDDFAGDNTCDSASEEIIADIITADESYMRIALAEAATAAKLGEVPVGAVIVKDGEIIARSHNLVESNRSSSAHAEMLALAEAEERLKAKWLTGATMYVTLEPCSMCAGAVVLARLDRLVIGAKDPKTGACGSRLNIACNEELNHRVETVTGILEEECSKILKDFFRARR